MKVGDRVQATVDLWDGDGENSPRGVIARRGEELEIRAVHVEEDLKTFWPYYVAHPTASKDQMFGVHASEIEPLTEKILP